MKTLAVETGRFSRPGLRRAAITGLATYVPPRVLTNSDLEKMVETSDEWIQQRTGIRERHIVDPGVATSDLAKEAALKAIAQAGLTPADIDFIVVGTTTPDMMFPSTACLLQHKIGAKKAWGFDLGAACSGFTYALTTAAHMVAAGTIEHALVVGADVMSSILDYTDRTTCVLFGDGAGAAVVSPSTDREFGILDFEAEIDGSGGGALCMPAGGSLQPASKETVEQRLHYVKQDGQAVFRFAVKKTEEMCRRLLERNRPAAGRHRPDGVAPGQPPDHPLGRRAARVPRREGGHQHRELRQHHRGHHPAGPQRRHRGWPAEKGQPAARDLRRGRVHRRRAAGPLGDLGIADFASPGPFRGPPTSRTYRCSLSVCVISGHGVTKLITAHKLLTYI